MIWVQLFTVHMWDLTFREGKDLTKTAQSVAGLVLPITFLVS